MIQTTRFRWLAMLLIALGAFAVLAPGFGGPFTLDDFTNVASNANFHPDEWNAAAVRKAVTTNTSGPLGRPVSMASFVANVAATGMNPAPMKFTNAVLHGIAAILVGLLALRLFTAAPANLTPRQQVLAALLAAACWALHPLAITSTLYVVQRMNLLATLFTLAAMLTYLRARPWFFVSVPRAAAWLFLALLFWILGVLSKETAVLAPLYVLLMEWLIFRFRDEQGQLRAGWRTFVLGSAALVMTVILTMIALEWDRWMGGYENRPFTFHERVLTQARVIWHYAGMVLLPGHGKLGMFLDDISLSTHLLNPWTTLLSIVGLTGWTAGAVLLRKRAPLISFGLLFFLAGHLLESTIIPLEIAFEHRNYLPAIGLLIALSAGMMQLANRMELRLIEWLPLTALALFLAFFTVIRSVHWSDHFMLAQLEAQHHPESSRAHAQLGFAYTQFARQTSAESGWPAFYMEAAAGHFEKSTMLDPNALVPLFLWHLHARAHDQPFPDEMHVELLERLGEGRLTADTPSSLNMTFECVMEGCGVQPSELETMLRAALENPRNQGRRRAEILVITAKYFRHVRNDPGNAVFLLAQAVESSPGIPRFRLFLARQLMESGNVAAAQEQISAIAELDKWGVYGDDLAELVKAGKSIKAISEEAVSDTGKSIDHPSGQE